MNVTRLLLLLLTFLAISGEAATLGLGIVPSDRDQTHGCVESVDEFVSKGDTEAGQDGGTSTFFDTPPAPIMAVCLMRLPVMDGRHESAASIVWGKLRKHRWFAVDLN